MTHATLTALRNLTETMNATETRTAREMALLPHNLDASGDIATEPNGTRWAWVGKLSTGHWARTV